MASAIARLNDFGQSPWYDNITRTLVRDGGLQRLIDEDGIRGVTSNPTIFDKAIAGGEGYDDQLLELHAKGVGSEDAFWALAVDDIGTGADLLRPVYDRTDRGDGFISIEVSLALAAHDVLVREGIASRVVSMPSWELFEAQPQSYRDAVLPPHVRARVSVEAASPFGWERYVGRDGVIIGVNRFGASAPGPVVMREYGFTADHVVAAARQALASRA
jgi:hypothetical protein